MRRERVPACVHPETYKYFLERDEVVATWERLAARYGPPRRDPGFRTMEVVAPRFRVRATQLGNPVRWATTSLNTNNGQQICGRGPTPFPNGADYSLWLLPTYVRQEDGHIRGLMPGMLWMPQDRPYSDQTIVDNVVGQAGKRFLLVRSQYSSETEGAQIAFDITGPWR